MPLEQIAGAPLAKFNPPGLGWHRDMQDYRDYTPQSAPVQELLGQLPVGSEAGEKRPESVDLRAYFPAVYNQREIHSSTAQVCVGLVEYFDNRAFGKSREPASLFLHQMLRKLLRTKDDIGISLRTAFKAMIRFGIPPEPYWPYEPEKLELEPEAFLYSFASAYQSIRYLRLDLRNSTGAQSLNVLRAFLAAGFPVGFGFPVPSSISSDGTVPYRPTIDSIRGGQAVVAVGYDDRRIGPTRGALLFRNSWGSQWGEGGYGWLPYRYVEEQLAVDFWTIISPQWMETGEFMQPQLVATP